MNRNDLSINFISAFVSVGFLFLEGEGYIATGEPGAHKWAASGEALNCPTGPVHAS